LKCAKVLSLKLFADRKFLVEGKAIYSGLAWSSLIVREEMCRRRFYH